MTSRTEAPLAGRTALVTGGGSGLGRAITRSLLADGARVVITGRNVDSLKRTADELGPGVVPQVCDVSRPADVDALASALADEEISILVNNAACRGPRGAADRHLARGVGRGLRRERTRCVPDVPGVPSRHDTSWLR